MSDEKKEDQDIHDTEEPEKKDAPSGSPRPASEPLPEPPPPGGGSTEGPGE